MNGAFPALFCFAPHWFRIFSWCAAGRLPQAYDCRLDGWSWWNWSGRWCAYGMHRRKTYDRENGYGGLSGYEQLGGNGEHRGDREN